MPNQETRRGMGRREFLVGGALVLGGVALDRLALSYNIPSRAADGPTPSPSPTGIPGKDGAPTPSGKPEVFSVCPPSELQTKLEKQVGHIQFGGIPEKADNILLATGEFKNTVRAGTEAFFAEPGALLVGPDFESKFNGNPYGDNPNGWKHLWESKGHINAYDAEYHEIASTCPPFIRVVPTNGFAQIIGNQFSVELYRTDDKGNLVSEGKAFSFLETHPGINIFTMRGLFADAKVQNQDRNRLAVVRNYVPGTIEYKMYPPGRRENSAFISEGQLLQVVKDAHDGRTNCGTGCSEVFVTSVDLNTGGWHFSQHTAGQEQNPRAGWNLRFKNFNS